MATFTFRSITASIIEVQAGDGTLAQLYTDCEAQDATAMSNPGGGQIYAVEGQRELELESGVVLEMEPGDTLRWDNRTGSDVSMDFQSGSIFNVGINCTIDGDFDGAGSNARYTYWYQYGESNLIGTSGNEITIKHIYGCRFFYREGENSTWDYVNCEDAVYGNYGVINLQASLDGKPAHSFTNITCTDSRASANVRGYGLYFQHGDFSGCTFDNFSVDGVEYMVGSPGIAMFKVTNSTFQNCDASGIGVAGGAVRPYYHFNGESTTPYLNGYNQPKITFDTCTFYDNYQSHATYRYGFSYNMSGVIKFKDCTFGGANTQRYGSLCYYRGVSLYVDCTFTNCTNPYYISNKGGHYDCKTLTLTVQDKDGTAIQGAIVTVRETNGKHVSYFETNASGEVKDVHGDDPIFPYRQITNNAGTSFNNWSTYDLTVSDITSTYTTYKETGLDFTSDVSKTITLRPQGTIIYDSTLYDATIY